MSLWSSGSQGSDIRYPVYQIFTLQLITVAKLQLWGGNKNNLMDGVTITREAVLKGHGIRKAENHCRRHFAKKRRNRDTKN